MAKEDGLIKANKNKSSTSSEAEKEMAKEDRLIRAKEIESSSSSEDVEDPVIRSIFCLKENVSMEEFDQVEDCYILEFDPFKSIDLSEKLSLKDNDDDDASEELSVITNRCQVLKPLASKLLTDCVAKENGFIRRVNKIDSSSSSSSEDDGSTISSIFCLKKNVSMEELDQVEDCYILDFDPFESIDLFDKLSLKDGDDDDEELSVIGQRGKVACIDYPHSRHLCAKFPFNKTPHEDYCEQCYCYVCDSIAPCKSWKKPEGGRHCDATEHDLLWKNLRIKNKSAPPPTREATLSS